MLEPTIFLVDDDASVRDSVALLLSLKGLRSQLFASAEDFLGTYRPEWRGCLLTDLRMSGMSGLELQQQLVERKVSLPVILLTAHGDVATTRAAMKAGAFDFLEKPFDDAVLVDVLQNAIAHDAAAHKQAFESARQRHRIERLTPREREVVALVSRGLPNREIALALDISPRTVEVYKARMMEKLDCRTLADVLRIAPQLEIDTDDA
ncbi:MAG TPA: response regulator [Steroidobacteraceae bacterium]|jgi:FixJ family two-component response regulator|nr:response regulator [Steroidobacteraceae bacterium]